MPYAIHMCSLFFYYITLTFILALNATVNVFFKFHTHTQKHTVRLLFVHVTQTICGMCGGGFVQQNLFSGFWLLYFLLMTRFDYNDQDLLRA